METMDGEMVEEIQMEEPPRDFQTAPTEEDPSNLQVIGQEMVVSETFEADEQKVQTVAAGIASGGKARSSSRASPNRTPLALVPYTPPSRTNGRDSESTGSKGILEGSSWKGPQRSVPGSLGLDQATSHSTPLFTPEQLAVLEDSYERHPLVYGSPSGLRRPDWLRDEIREGRGRELAKVKSPEDDVSWRYQMENHLKELGLSLRASQAENARLRAEMQLLLEFRGSASRYSTPASLKEDGPDCQQVQDGPSDPKAKEDGPAGRKAKEDGPAGRKAKEDGPAGQKDLKDGPRGQQDGEGNSKGKPVISDRIEGKGAFLGGGKGKGDGLEVDSSSSSSEANQDKTMHLVLRLMENMQNLQKQVLEAKDDRSLNEVEWVRQSADLPKLPEWNAETAPIDFNDWMLCIQPYMADLTATSGEWWELMVQSARAWYNDHMQLAPLARLTHVPKLSEEVNQKRWSRLERRASSMLMSSIPENLREEVVSSKCMNTISILTKGMVMFQPGGLSERASILAALENPVEAASIPAATQGLRRWVRWKRRAEELGVSVPDATILMRGLHKLTKRILTMFPDLSFRLSLVRNGLLVDTLPTLQSVSQYSEHILAELEQMGQHVRKKEGGAGENVTKLKKVEEPLRGGKKEDQKPVDVRPCKFFLTESGCRKGKQCRFGHDQKDDQRRCYSCGSTLHMVGSCPVKEANAGSPPKNAKMSKEVDDGVKSSGSGAKEEESSSKEEEIEVAADEGMSSLLQDAQKMLKSLSKKSEASSCLEELQNKLNQLKKNAGSLKALRLTQLKTMQSTRVGLLDSGATNPLRPLRKDEELEKLQRVKVTLANGSQVPMLMTQAGVMVSLQMDIEPILPISWLDSLGFEILWKNGEVKVKHPDRESVKVDVRSGCPQIDYDVALKLIDEYEDRACRLKKMSSVGSVQQDVEWMEELLKIHPVLKDLPEHVRRSLVQQPGEWADLPTNRHGRKHLRNGFICHLYAGGGDGMTFRKAMKDLGLGAKVLEVDLCRGEQHDLLGQSKVYGGLIRAALDGSLWGLIGGPNCRTRSVLRFIENGGPRPVRLWHGEEWGLKDLSPKEALQVEEDDLLMWRMIFLGTIADYAMKVVHPEKTFRFGLEQPAVPTMSLAV